MFIRRFYSTPIGNLQMFSLRKAISKKKIDKNLHITKDTQFNQDNFKKTNSYQHMYNALKYRTK